MICARGFSCENVLSITSTKGKQYIDSCHDITDFEWSDRNVTIQYKPTICWFCDATLQVGLKSNKFVTAEELEAQNKEALKEQEMAFSEARKQVEEARRKWKTKLYKFERL